jgi:hypothetical protein
MESADDTRNYAGMIITEDDQDCYRLRVLGKFASMGRYRRGSDRGPRLLFLSHRKRCLFNHLTLPISPLG